jgi:hypothetical protein
MTFDECFHFLKAQRVEEVRKMSEQYSVDLKERIERKMETMGEKREAQLQSIQERIREHVRHDRRCCSTV